MDKILAVIPVHNRRETTLAILERLRTLATSAFQLDVLIIDDGSSDGTSEAVATRYPDVLILYGDGNLWWGGALNMGFRHGLEHNYEYIYTLNDDIVLNNNTLVELYDAANRLKNTVCSSVILNKDDQILAAGYVFAGFLRKIKSPHKNKHYESLIGDTLPSETLSTQSVLIPVSVLKQGLFIDDVHFPHNYSDINYFDTVRKSGFGLAVVRKSVIRADESSSNYHQLIVSRTTRAIIPTFMNIKYAHNVRTQWNIAGCKYPSTLLRLISFVGLMTPYLTWLGLKILLPNRMLTQLLAARGRIMAPKKAKQYAG